MSSNTRSTLFTRPFVMAACANFALGIADFLMLHFPGFLQALGAGEAEIGRVLAIQPLVAMLLSPMVGRVMDRRGRTIVILCGAALDCIGLALYFTVSDLGPWVYVVGAVRGAARVMVYTALFTFGADHIPAERRTEGLALFGASGLLPIAIGGLLGDWLLARASYEVLFGSALVLAVLGFGLVLTLRDGEFVADHDLPRRGVLATAFQRDLIPVWCAAAAFFVAAGALFTFMKTYVVATGLGSVGGFFSAYSFTAVSLRLFAARLPDRVGPKRLLAPAVASYAAGLAVLAAAGSGWMVIAAGILCGIGHGYIFPILFGMVIDRARASERGSAMALYTAIDSSSHFVAGPMFGSLIELQGYTISFAAAAGLIATGTIVFYLTDTRYE